MPGHSDSYSTKNDAAVEVFGNTSIITTKDERSSKPKCGLRQSGFVHNASSCVTIFCNFILVSRHWAFMPMRCAIPSESGGVRQNLFTMGRLSHEDEKDYSLVQTVRGEKIVAHAQ